ncbi:MAG: hypothetical protein QOJ76_1927 [Acidobacteriota bacterium]|jgi:hypothetical protein|nr:hypothetical protein [Acidobacteriota bacterium]
MLFVESRTADRVVEKHLRTPLLEALQERGFVPLIRAARLHFFEQAASGAERARDLERAVSERADAEGEEPYVRGDVFCTDDLVHFLIFGDGFGGAGLRAGIVYDAETDAPAAKLEAFCRSVQDALAEAARVGRGAGAQADADGAQAEVNSAETDADGTEEPHVTDGARDVDDADGTAPARVEWRVREGQTPELFSRFAAVESPVAEASHAQRGAGAAERARAIEILEDAGARGFLQRLSEAHADGRAVQMFAGGRGPEQESQVARLAGAGLVRREVQVSCRKDGRSLFRLPSPEALTMVTASNAVCSECGAAVADERAEELVTPTALASSMLKDGAWLVSSLRSILTGLGIPEKEIAPRTPSAEGEAQVFANVCGEPFLFVLREGDYTAAHARRALEGEAEAHATRLVVVAAGKVQDDARARLREHARRRSRAGSETEAVFVEGLDAAADELRPLVERVSQEALTRELYELDADAGFNVGYALAARFRLMQRKGALRDLAASAAGAMTGNLREF